MGQYPACMLWPTFTGPVHYPFGLPLQVCFLIPLQWFTPLSCHCLLGYEFQKVGRLCYKSMLNPNQWLQGFFILQKSHLFICPGEEGAAEDSINLRQLQELSE